MKERIEDVEKRIETLEEAIAEQRYQSEVLLRNDVGLHRTVHIGNHFSDFTDDLRFSKGELFIEFRRSTSVVNHRVEGFVVSFEGDDVSKTIGIWCTKNNELLKLRLGILDECRVGELDNGEHLAVQSTCMDCRQELVDCRCV